MIVGAKTGKESSKLPIAHICFGNDIDRFRSASIVNTSKLCLVAEPIKYLYLINDLRRQIAKCSRSIVTKKISAINSYFFDLLTANFHLPIFNRDARSFFDKVFRIGILVHL